jgi:hypothetical protein
VAVANFKSWHYYLFSSWECSCVIVSFYSWFQCHHFRWCSLFLSTFIFNFSSRLKHWDSLEYPVDFTFQCGFSMLIGFFVSFGSWQSGCLPLCLRQYLLSWFHVNSLLWMGSSFFNCVLRANPYSLFSSISLSIGLAFYLLESRWIGPPNSPYWIPAKCFKKLSILLDFTLKFSTYMLSYALHVC